MKIAILASSAQLGGAERVTINLANEFAARGHRVDLVLGRAKGELLPTISAGVDIVDLRAPSAWRSIVPFRRYIRSARPDAVLAITYEMNLAAALAVLGMRDRPRLVLSVHGSLKRMKATPLWWRVPVTGLSKLLYRRADYVVAVSDGVVADLVSAGWVTSGKIRKIYNPVVSADFPTRAAEPLPPHVEHDRSIPTVVAVGRLSPEKRHDLLLQAFKKVTEVRPARLWIVGEGTLRKTLEQQIEKLALSRSVQLVGYVSNPFSMVRAANVFVMTSDREGLPTALIEAIALGTPAISTDCPHGPRDILAGGRWGKLVPCGDAQAVAVAILEALADGAIDSGERARDFTVEAAADGYLAILAKDLTAIPRAEHAESLRGSINRGNQTGDR